MILSNGKTQNVLSVFLQKMNVKYTPTFANKLYNEHPHKYNLFGLSKMLSEYKIENAGLRIENKDEGLASLEVPFIAQSGGEFVTVYKIGTKKVSYIWKGKKLEVSLTEFKDSWTGVVLVGEADKDSIEPNYNENKKKGLIKQIQQALLLGTIGTLILLAFIQGELYKSVEFILLLITNLAGMYISHLLILKQLHIQSSNADKICSLFDKSDCNDVLDSPAAKFLGVISWSEVGLSYFISNFIILLFIPSLIPFMALINILALPYSFWSIWYQKFKAKTWCPLCLIVQVLLWLLFIVNISFGYITIPDFTLSNILLVGCIYALPYLCLNQMLPIITESRKVEQIRQEMNSLKMNDDVFTSLLKKQPYYTVDKSESSILFGNPNASTLITVITNPHCEPCARMHKRIDTLLKEIGDKICLQYIFTSFSEELNDSCKILISAYKNKSNWEEIYGNWYESGKSNISTFIDKFDILYNSTQVNDEFELHEKWVNASKIYATPTIIYNGYELPDKYTIEDLKYFTNLVIDTK